MGDTVADEWKRGWTLVLTSCLGSGVTAVVPYSIGLFSPPLEHQFGWSRADVYTAISITAIITGCGSPFIGQFMDRAGARRIALTGCIFISLTIACLSVVSGSIFVYWAIWVLISFGYLMTSPLIWTMAVANRFEKSRGLALSVTLCGSNISGAISPPLTAFLIATFGWRIAFDGLALLVFLLGFPLALAFFFDARDLQRRDGPATADFGASRDLIKLESGDSPAAALRSANFWFIAAAFLLGGISMQGLIGHFIPMLTDIGVKPEIAAALSSAISLGAVTGRLANGYLLDRLFAPRLAAVAMMFPLLTCFILATDAGSTFWAAFAAIALGLSLGAEVNMVSYLAARYFGLRHYGFICGVIYGGFALGIAAGAFFPGYLFDQFGNYNLALKLMAALLVLSGLLLMCCGKYPDWSADRFGGEAISVEQP